MCNRKAFLTGFLLLVTKEKKKEISGTKYKC